jgi:hypothetical protein
LTTFTPDETISCLEKHAALQNSRKSQLIRDRIQELKLELENNANIRDLLSRPVHLPMLVLLLPDWTHPISELGRATLYGKFIDKIITRELLRKRKEFRENYGLDQRHRFASSLALEMFRRGESRIRYSEIPESVIEPFRKPGTSLDSTKRDLISACFLDRKAPDILFFPHKSFGEYLVAECAIEDLKKGTAQCTKKQRIAYGHINGT